MRKCWLIVAIATLLLGSGNISADSGDLIDTLGPNSRLYRHRETFDILSIGRLQIAPWTKTDAKNTVAAKKFAASQFLSKFGPLFGLNPQVLKVLFDSHSQHRDQHLLKYVYEVALLPVFLEQASIQVDGANQVRRFTGPTFASDHRPVIHPAADSSTLASFGKVHGYDQYREGTPGWIRHRNNRLRAVIRYETLETDGALPLALYVSAKTGNVLQSEPIAWTVDPEGFVLEENPVTTPVPILVPLPYIEEEAENLIGKYARVVTCVDKKSCKETVPLANRGDDPNGNFAYRPMFDEQVYEDPFAEVNAYYHVSRINAWVRQTYGWKSRFKGNTWIEVKVGRSWYNAAFYQGTKERAPFLLFGQDVVDFAYDADVIFHEFGHAINRTIWQHPWHIKDNLGIDVAMFSLEEAAADIWAQHFSGNPVMDNYIAGSRTALNATTCPEDILSEGHMEARIISAFAWDVRRTVGPEAFGHIFYRTLHFLSKEANFDEFATTLADSAEDLYTEKFPGLTSEHKKLILELATARGLTSEACLNRIVPMEEAETRRSIGYGSSRTGKHHYPGGLQWKITLPRDTEMLALFLKWSYPNEEDKEGVTPGYKVFLRRGAPVEIDWLDEEDLAEDLDAYSAIADVEIPGAPELVEFPFEPHRPLEPGEEIYVLIASDTNESLFVVDAAYYLYKNNGALPPPAEPDGGIPPSQSRSYVYKGDQACSVATPGQTTYIREIGLFPIVKQLFQIEGIF